MTTHVDYWDGSTRQQVTLTGYWDGTAVQPLTGTVTWWDGTTRQALTTDTPPTPTGPQATEVLHGVFPADSTSMVLATAAATTTSDWLVAIHVSDYLDAAGMTAPTSSGSWTSAASQDNGNNQLHMKMWVKKATAGVNTVTFHNSSGNGSENYGVLYRITGATGWDSAGHAGSTTNATAHVAPSVAPYTHPEDFLVICAFAAEDATNGGTGTYTAPAGMTIQSTDVDSGNYAQLMTCTQSLSTTDGAAIGTRTATYSVAQSWVAATMIVGIT